MMPKCRHDHSAFIAPPAPPAPMRLTRCHVSSSLAAQSELTLPPGPSAHLARVLRVRAGAELTLFDGQGGESPATVRAVERGGVRVRTGAHRALEREAPVAVTLLQCLLRTERMDLIVQKATELGAAAIVPIDSRNSLVRLDAAAAERRRLHWLAIAIGACEQCGRNRVPLLQALQSFEHACRATAGDDSSPASRRLLLDPSGQQSFADALPGPAAVPRIASLILMAGPEGGFSSDELALAQQHGFEICQLGPRILRAETAPLAALATVQALLGDFGAGAVAIE
jgi:16S rRNA (uracil1498-N3)-methyltransferase